MMMEPRPRKLITPMLYVQGKGAIYHLGQKALPFGNRAYVVGGRTALSVTGDKIRKSLESNGIEVAGWDDSVRECTRAAIDALSEKGKHINAHFVVCVGGGKAVDTAKAVAWKLRLPAVVVGTQCATNADASAESVVYTDDHRFQEVVALQKNPVLVVEDTEVLFRAPHKFLVWGMGDAVATRYEGEAFAAAREKRGDGLVPTGAALALGQACFRSLMEHGSKAVKDAKNGIHSREVDEVIEAVKLSSALAFENTGCALAHALHNGLMKTGQVKGEHGEVVAYGTIVQAAYEGRPRDEVQRLIQWCGAVGLPTTLKAIGDPSKAALRQAAEHACEKDHNAQNMPDKMRPADLLEVMDRVEHGF
jgi:glycerol dehydrogenase